ncbi:hypothetical protein DPEC_G00039900 [Dallia pectoralis]|uniref:Uncharacterized protein n=1 Tax=Dallia pectoralis TaxID=75939 RepID=A0ACC2HF06_DALPE|nr:hypothetical protein DPEC_G00039900 [Dallia pectoralis]
MIAGIISLMVMVTVIISTVMFLRNKKSNRILPHRRIRRRNKPPVKFNFPNHFRTPNKYMEKFLVQEPDVVVDNINCNNCNMVTKQPRPHMNVVSGHLWSLNQNGTIVSDHNSPQPPPPNAPALPPMLPGVKTGDRQWNVPTVSAIVPQLNPMRNGNRPIDSVNVALVSELKMRLDKRRLLNHY